MLESDTSATARYDADSGGLVMPDWSGGNFIAGEIGTVIPTGVSTSGRAYAERRPVLSPDYLADESIASDDAVRNRIIQVGFRAGLSVPIIIRDEVYGVIATHFFTIHNFTDGEIQLLQALADSAAVAIGNARFIHETQQARKDAEARERQTAQLYAVTAQLASKHDLDSVLNLITQQAAEFMSGRAGNTNKFDHDRGGLVVATMYGLDPEWKNSFLYGQEKGLPAALFRSGG